MTISGTVPVRNDRREIAGWLLYDWANSAFQTTVVTVLIGPYLTALAQHDVGTNGVVLRLGPFGTVTALSLYPFCIAASVVLQVLLLPLLGALVDYTGMKKRLMMAFCYAGAAATCLMFFVARDRYLAGSALLVAANFAFGVTLVLYNAFLNDITTPDLRDRVSSHGYAVGYLGGGLLLAGNLALLGAAARLGISRELAVRISLASAGVWWGGFSVITLSRLRALPRTRRYLLAYMAFNDAIQTVISVSSVFLAQELFVARGRPADEAFLMELVLRVQFVAFAGALLFRSIAAALDTKPAILLSLVLWTAIVVYAYAWLETIPQAWAMGGALAVVLGGSQALSRSLFSRMIPDGHEAAFFGLYEITERGTSWIGPLIFGAVAGATGSYRQAILSLVALFAAGIVLLAATDTERAIREAHAEWDVGR